MNTSQKRAVTDEELIAAVHTAGSHNKAARALGIHRSTVDRRMQTLVSRGYSPQHDMTHLVPQGFNVKGHSTLYDAEGKVSLQWVKTQRDNVFWEQAIEDAIKASIESLPRLPKRWAMGDYESHLMVGYPIGDAHIGMCSWGVETGQDWDLKIAERTQCAAMDYLVNVSPAAETAVIVNLGDWFHYDSMNSVTPRSGHHLDSDGRYGKIIRVGIKVMRQCIESALKKHKFVHVINVIGNHDETGALWLAQMLAHVYEDEPRVTVETSPSVYTYFEFGKVLVGCHHGHTTKAGALPGVMAADRPGAWGRTVRRYWWTGHIHHESKKEYAGVQVESFNTLAPNDSYAHQGGWRSDENMKAIVLHREFGEVSRNIVNPAMLKTIH